MVPVAEVPGPETGPASGRFGVVHNVKKVFAGKNHPITAIDHASVGFDQGDFVSFLGPSGCGKTTLLRVIAGLLPRTSGSVHIDGEPVTRPRPDFSFMFQSLNLLPWRTVVRNILFPLELHGGADRTARARCAELLEKVGLTGFETSRPHELSGGMQQRVALCRALIVSPKLLLMDEPFGALDELTRMEMHDLLLNVCAEANVTVLFVTHSISEAVYLSSRVIVFSKRPARIVDEVEIPFGYPRSMDLRYRGEFAALEQRISRSLGILA